MTLFVDTSVWSLALRRDSPPRLPEVAVLAAALEGPGLIVSTGFVLQELLTGALPAPSRARIETAFASLSFVMPTRADHSAAAALGNTCRRHGVRLQTVDALLAQLCIANDLTLLSTDADFSHAARHIPLRVWSREGRRPGGPD